MMLRRMQYEFMKNAGGTFLTGLQRYQAFKKRGKRGARPPFGPPLESVERLKEIMTRYYFTGRYADGAVPVAWVTSGFPSEALVALGYHLVYPENHAALCGARRKGGKMCGAAEEFGYPRDICSYVRTDLGSLLSKKTPVGRLPKPDLLCCCTNICQTVLYWYRALAKHLDVPLVIIDTPFIYGEAPTHHLEYVRGQLDQFIEVAERIGGKKLSPEHFVDTVKKAQRASSLWGECLATGKAKPSPWSAIDSFFHIAPVVTIRGSDECVDYYQMLLNELTERARKGVGAIDNERHRLLWDNLPIWFLVRDLALATAERGFQFVCATYSNAWAEAGSQIDPSTPLDSTARTYTSVYLNRDLDNRTRSLIQLARDFDADGAVLHSDRSCKPYSVGQVDVRNRLMEEEGIRAMLLEADHNDERSFSKEQALTRLQAFMEAFDE